MASIDIQKLNREHPLHALYKDVWDDFDLLNAGGIRLKNQAQRFLVKRPKELFDVYQERIKRFTYQNIMGQIVGWYVGAMFRREPNLDLPAGADQWYKERFLANCDRGGKSYVALFRDIFRSLILYKCCFVLTDRPHADEPPSDRADEQARGLDQPYLVNYDPRQVLNWQADSYGNLNWVVIRTEEEAGNFLSDGVDHITRWYYFDRQNYQVYEHRQSQRPGSGANVYLVDPYGNRVDLSSQTAQLVDEGLHALAKVNRVPVRAIQVNDELWLANRVYLQLCDHINQDNSLGWALFMANLAMPVVFSDGDVGPQTMSEAGFLKFGQADKFEWTEPAGHSFETSGRRLDRLREEIYRTVYLQAQGRSSSASASSQSGYSKEMDMMPANDVLNAYGDILIPAMQDVFRDVVAARGDDDQQILLDANGFHFETKPAAESVSLYEEFLTAGIFEVSPTLERVIITRIAMDVIEDQNEDTKQAIKDEIEKSPMSREREQQQQQQDIQNFQQRFQQVGYRAMAREEESTLAA